MKFVNSEIIFRDYDMVMMTNGGEDEAYLNYLLVPMVSGLPIELLPVTYDVWVMFDSAESDPNKCWVETIHEGAVYRRCNPFIDGRIQYFFENLKDSRKDVVASSMIKLFPNVKFKFITS